MGVLKLNDTSCAKQPNIIEASTDKASTELSSLLMQHQKTRMSEAATTIPKDTNPEKTLSSVLENSQVTPLGEHRNGQITELASRKDKSDIDGFKISPRKANRENDPPGSKSSQGSPNHNPKVQQSCKLCLTLAMYNQQTFESYNWSLDFGLREAMTR